jgi:hypothetical protein
VCSPPLSVAVVMLLLLLLATADRPSAPFSTQYPTADSTTWTVWIVVANAKVSSPLFRAGRLQNERTGSAWTPEAVRVALDVAEGRQSP